MAIAPLLIHHFFYGDNFNTSKVIFHCTKYLTWTMIFFKKLEFVRGQRRYFGSLTLWLRKQLRIQNQSMEEIFLMIYFYKHIRWMLLQQYPIVIFMLSISSCTLANDTHVNRILSLKMPLHASKKKNS